MLNVFLKTVSKQSTLQKSAKKSSLLQCHITVAKQLFLQKKVKQYKVSPPKTKSTATRAFCFTKSLLVPLGFLAKKKDELFVRLYIIGTPKGNTRICLVYNQALKIFG